MGRAISYDAENDLFVYECDCGKMLEQDVTDFISVYSEDFAEYTNYAFRCDCRMIHTINMNIPAGDYEEIDLELGLMPFYEINARKAVRDFMWDKREDLMEMDRDEYNEQTRQENEQVEELLQVAQEGSTFTDAGVFGLSVNKEK